jgi:hypothetical protein
MNVLFVEGNDARANVTYMGRGDPYTYTGDDMERKQPVTYTNVTDDFGEHVQIRRGEFVILAELFDAVIAEARSKVANDN